MASIYLRFYMEVRVGVGAVLPTASTRNCFWLYSPDRVCVFSSAIATFVFFYCSFSAFCCVFVDYSVLSCNCCSVNESKLSHNVVVILKEAVQIAHRYCRIICLLLMGIVLKTKMVGSLKCTSMLKGMGMNCDISLPTIMYLPKHSMASTSDRQFSANYQSSYIPISITYKPLVQRLNFFYRQFHEHNFTIVNLVVSVQK
jgi:hypothetical protein